MARLPGEERRAQLLAVARDEFLRAGAGGARIRDIARRADVNVASIYNYFESKEALFEAAIVEPLDDLVDRLQAEATGLPAGDLGVVEYTRLFYVSVLEIFAETVELFGVVLFGDRDHGRQFYAERIAPFIDAVAGTVRSNMSSWQHRDFDPAETTPLFVGMAWGAAMDAHFRGVALDRERVAELMIAITFDGLRGTQPGR